MEGLCASRGAFWLEELPIVFGLAGIEESDRTGTHDFFIFIFLLLLVGFDTR